MNHGMSLDVQRALMMHDVTEAYLGDIVAGLKKLLPDYTAIESRLAEMIQEKYRLFYTAEILDTVKELDTCILLDESLYLCHITMNISQSNWLD